MSNKTPHIKKFLLRIPPRPPAKKQSVQVGPRSGGLPKKVVVHIPEVPPPRFAPDPPSAKLNRLQVALIRESVKAGSPRWLPAMVFDVDAYTIRDIVTGRSWEWLPELASKSFATAMAPGVRKRSRATHHKPARRGKANKTASVAASRLDDIASGAKQPSALEARRLAKELIALRGHVDVLLKPANGAKKRGKIADVIDRLVNARNELEDAIPLMSNKDYQAALARLRSYRADSEQARRIAATLRLYW